MVRQLQHLTNQSFELRGLRADGTPFWALMSARLSRNAQGEAFVHGSLIDITEQKTANEQLAYLASHDPLTGLYNRHHFLVLAQQAWQRRQLEQQSCAVLFIDIDQFKLVNTTCDHAAGAYFPKHQWAIRHVHAPASPPAARRLALPIARIGHDGGV